MLLTSGLGIHYLVSNVISLLVLTLVRYGLADSWIWAKASPPDVQTSGPYAYDIHGIVSVSSRSRLPELERFRVDGAGIGEPDIRVRLGRVSANGDRVGSADSLPRGPGRPRIRGDDPRGRPIEATASPLVGRSPHVLYTNVVEPILRWSFAERGYALVHAACLADRGRAFLLTARTDTGKTTTSLKILDSTAVLVPVRRPDAPDARTGGC